MGAWGVAPSEFGRLTLRKWWLIYDAKRPPDNDGVAYMDEEQLGSLYEKLFE